MSIMSNTQLLLLTILILCVCQLSTISTDFSTQYPSLTYPQGENRNLLQSQNSSCTYIGSQWIDNDTYFANDTCVIHLQTHQSSINCDPSFPNCYIKAPNCGSCLSSATVQCPPNNCDECVIKCGGICKDLIVYNHCKLLQMSSKSGDPSLYMFENCTIDSIWSGAFEMYGAMEIAIKWAAMLQPLLTYTYISIHSRSMFEYTYFWNDTFVIVLSTPKSWIVCDPSFPNCYIQTHTVTHRCPNCINNATVQCPSNNCGSCLIDSWYGGQDLVVRGKSCHTVSLFLSVLGDRIYNTTHDSQTGATDTQYEWIPYKFDNCTVYAPDNGGTLEIYGSMEHSHIYSKPGTQNIVLFLFQARNNVIDGQYITGDLNVTCGIADEVYQQETPHIESTSSNQLRRQYIVSRIIYSLYIYFENVMFTCKGTNITCGSSESNCDINCFVTRSSSLYSSAGDVTRSTTWRTIGQCANMMVFAEGGSAHVNWYCEDGDDKTCLNAKLGCGNKSSPIYSKWLSQFNIYGAVWYYEGENCVETRIPPPVVTCTFIDNDGCYFFRQYMNDSKSIECGNAFISNCQVQLGLKDDTTVWPTNLESVIHCPSSNCDSCLIGCMNKEACTGLTIYGYNCSSVQINIEPGPSRINQQERVTIYAPGNGGELRLLVMNDEVKSGYGDIRAFTIHSVAGTKNIIIDVQGIAFDIAIYGIHVTDSLNVTCGKCTSFEFFCPNDANCNLHCLGDTSCADMKVYAIEGTHDVNWKCDRFACTVFSSINQLYCKQNYIASSDLIWNEQTLVYEWSNHIDGGCINLPTERPSLFPTIPSQNPTQPPTLAPSSAPTQSPTSAPTIPTFSIHTTGSRVMLSAIAFVLIFIVVACIYYYQYYKPEKMSLYMKNALVILVGISDYDEEVEEYEIDGYLKDLYGIDKDIDNMVELFHNTLNFDIYSNDDCDWDKIEGGWWTKDSLTKFLKSAAHYLDKKVNDPYDGLVVVISCHGVLSNIATTDYKKISKIEICRYFSSSNSSTIPRLFVFDCCSGHHQQERLSFSDDTGKGIEAVNLDNDDSLLKQSEQNLDYKLAIVQAANPGFQSKIRSDLGSYVVHSFYTKTMQILSEKKKTFLYETFDEVQTELHEMGKQHPTFIYNDGTRYIRFKRNDKEVKPYTEILDKKRLSE